MNCNLCKELISSYINDEISYEDKEKIRKHLEECESCRNDYEALINNIELCNELPMIDLPQSFNEDLHNKLVNIDKENKNIFNKIINNYDFKSLAIVAIIFLMIITPLLSHFDIINYEKHEKDETYDIAQNNIEVPRITASKWTLANDMDKMAKSRKNDNIIMDNAEEMEPEYFCLQADDEAINNLSNKNYKITVEDDIDSFFNYTIDYVNNVSQDKAISVNKDIKNNFITVDISNDSFQAFIDYLKNNDKIIGYEMSNDDVTEEYNNLQNELNELLNTESKNNINNTKKELEIKIDKLLNETKVTIYFKD